ncbi:MAG TPA: DUF2520 domain-containing protein [Bacteroidales bacterium]|nr:MAG: hypothetical protein A2W98_15545 [Bacteroidetes bacterium GWF2_33_38]OFY90421.1 MAG: hypothetical protein A2236_11820 [Bacteroidetes bacterium RIFOXYA2_FULL_33_7]HBF89036.1 DUF2520 domain-containing protein [Bacteroidales bacterium]
MTSKINKIAIIGSGNLATNLAINLSNKDFDIVQIYSRNIENAIELAKQTNSEPISDLALLTKQADLYIVAVSDSAISEVVSKINIKNKLVVHTSGSVSVNVFGNKFENFGIFYSLQTFSKSTIVDFNNIPILIEANNIQNLNNLTNLARCLSNTVRVISSEDRQKIHIAAVFANNFTNHMYSLSQQYLESNNLDIELLKPLIIETAHKILDNNPKDIQTGPARRNDKITIEKHIEMLKNKPEFQKLYSFVSESILNFYKSDK